MFIFSLQNIEVNKNIVNKTIYDYLFTVDEVNQLVQQGVPFRDAYKIVGEKVSKGEFRPDKKVVYSHIGSIGNLGLEKIQAKMDKAISL